MPTTITRSSGLRLTLPEGIALADGKTGVSHRGTRQRIPGLIPMPGVVSAEDAAEVQSIADALTNQDMVLVDRLHLEPLPQTLDGTRAGMPMAPREISLEVDLRQDENAVVLLEQNGLYAWQFDKTDTPILTGTGGALHRGPRAVSSTATFRFTLAEQSRGPAKTRGWLSDLIVEKAQALVFRYAGRFLLSQGAAFLERKVRTGLVGLDGDDPQAWKHLTDFSSIPLPDDRRARILLFVHGTFSSTMGCFAALAATPWGRSFLAAARANYDAVIGFDHPTLSVDPRVNATTLLQCLETRHWVQPAAIDVVCHSRGGITIRSLIEHLLPAASLPVRVERVVFVGAVNGGTELAEPQNWRSLINLYTNLATGACRAIGMFPQAAFAASLAKDLLKSLGVLVKVLAEEAVTEQAVPGLAAMQPTGPFITELNQTQPGQPISSQSRYYAVTSAFEPRLALDTLKELPRQLLLALADGVVDQLMGKANDLVVNMDSMTHIDPQAGKFIKDTLAYGQNGVVYHTNYFLQPQTTNALSRWFELEPPRIASPARLRGVVRGGAAVPVSAPASMDTDVVVVLAEDTGTETLERIQKESPSYVVIERMVGGRPLHYALQTEETLDAIALDPHARLTDSLGLRESDASPAGQMDALPMPPVNASRPCGRRVVGLEGGRVVGVAEAEVHPKPLTELVEQAQQMTHPQTPQARIIARRNLPSLMNRDTISTAFLPASPPPLTASAPPRRTRGVQRNGPKETAPVDKMARKEDSPAESGERAAPVRIECHFLAEMDDEVVVGQTTSVDVTLSREVIQAVRGVSAAAGPVGIDADRQLIVELIPKKNFIAAGETRITVDPPEPEHPAQYVFDVTATDAGDGEVLVRIRQGMQPLANLLLQTRIVAVQIRPPVRRRQDARVPETLPALQPRHQLTIMEIERGGQKLYHFTLLSPTLGLSDFYESRPLSSSREDFVKRIYQDIEERYLSNPTDFEQFQQELREVGGNLWDELFPEKLQNALWTHRDGIESILVFSEEPFIPWELVHLKEPGMGLPPETRFFAQMGLVRWLHNVGWPTTALYARAGRCRFVIPSYPHPDFVLPAAQEEMVFLAQHFQATAVEPHAGPLRKLLQTPGGFDLLHFACHGVADSSDIASAELMLEGRVEGGAYVTEKLRASVIENLSSLVGEDGIHPIVALNACQAGRAGYKLTSIGGFSRAFIAKGAGLFVASLWSVGDAPARDFTKKLYERLLAGDLLADATVAARDAARAGQEATWLAYTVYGNPHARLMR